MADHYQAVGWNRQKRVYDATMVGGVLLYLAAFGIATSLTNPFITTETLLIRASGTAALLLLHVVLCIGPLCRLSPRFLPLLYNRRHLGVLTFLLGLVHAGVSVLQFHAFGDVNPLVSVLVSNPRIDSISQFPFQPLGFVALVILFLMAATSHDFWLANLTAPVWKALHMLVYVAYGLLIAHVAFGVLQAQSSLVMAGVLGVGLVVVVVLHVAAGWKEISNDREVQATGDSPWVDVCAVADIPDLRAKVVTIAAERVAIFKYEGKLSAVSSVCQHQNGPLGEGMVIDGLVTCPWHGYQYCPADGRSPEPFTEMIPTFNVRVRDGRVLVDGRPNPRGTWVPPAGFTE